jgi:hypothetical protein
MAISPKPTSGLSTGNDPNFWIARDSLRICRQAFMERPLAILTFRWKGRSGECELRGLPV